MKDADSNITPFLSCSASRFSCVLSVILVTAILGGFGCVNETRTRVAMEADAEEDRPNIVFILTDDQAPWAWSRSGYDQVKTPNMDRIAREGAYLVNAFVTTPVCSPSRATLVTSRYGTEIGITEWINHEWRNAELLHEPEPDLGLDPATVTWPEVLEDAGYHTGLIGKWHLGRLDQYHPTATGYQEFVGFLGGGNNPKDPNLEDNGERRVFEGFTQDILTDEALDFIRRHRDESFLLSLHYRAPHAPWLPLPEQDWTLYRDLDPHISHPDYPRLDTERVKRMTREYLGSVASVDRNVGRLLDLLDELNLAENTVVIFTSDHGYNMGHNGIWHKGNGHWVLTEPPPATQNIPTGQRPNMYDNSIRVPLAVRWPHVIKPGTVIDRTITNLDWYPTLLAMAGVSIPEGVLIRGRNLLPLLKGETVNRWDDDLYAQYSTHHQSRTFMRMYRTPRWKLIRDYLNHGRDEFYDLKNDPQETTNLIDSTSPEIRSAIDTLDKSLLEHMHLIDDPVLSVVNG